MNPRYKYHKEWRENNRDKTRSADDKWYAKNKDKKNSQRMALKRRKPELTKNTILKRNYGISLAEYNQILLSQKSRCAICDRHHTEFNKALAVDHCHITRKIRGLLCMSCNTTLGKFKDKTELLIKAIQYLGGSL